MLSDDDSNYPCRVVSKASSQKNFIAGYGFIRSVISQILLFVNADVKSIPGKSSKRK